MNKTVALIDEDNINISKCNFPNLALMKISAYYKKLGYNVKWYSPLAEKPDRVYISRVFTFSKQYPHAISACEYINRGGVGYGGYDVKLPDDIENTFPDYQLYPNPKFKNIAYGFLTKGCPRGCPFCNVGITQGTQTYKVSDLNSFWNGQGKIKLLDPNILAYKNYDELFMQLIESKAIIDFTQGLDIRLINAKAIDLINKMKTDMLHFAWDNAEDKITEENLKKFRPLIKKRDKEISVYILTNYNSTLFQDIYRILKTREYGYTPYVMIYNKDKLSKGHPLKKIQRLINNKIIYHSPKSNIEDELNEILINSK